MKFVFITLFSLSLNSWGTSLQTGDVVLISLPCQACKIIENETQSPYSHAGVIYREGEKLFVWEAWTKVRQVELSLFLKGRTPGTEPLYLRHQEFQEGAPVLKDDFDKKFLGLFYDSDYLWDNYDDQGKEKIYCTELITKLLNPYLEEKIPTAPMTFDRNWEFWKKHFKKDPPQDQQGNSPGSFSQLEIFQRI